MKALLTTLLGAALAAPTACAQVPADTARAGAGSADGVTAILGGVVHTQQRGADGRWRAPIEDGVVLIQGGRITAVGPRAEVPVPDGARVLQAAVVTPGLIDARSVVGLAGWLNYGHDQDQLETSEPLQPELRALDAFNGREPLLDWIRSFGVTTVHTGHAPGELITGQTMVVKNRHGEVDDAVLVPLFAVAATLGEDALAEGDKAPGTRAKQLALLRQALIDAGEYARKVARADAEGTERPARDLRKEMLAQVLAGEVPLMITCQRSIDIQNALRLAREFDLRLILDGAAEVYEHLDAVRAAGVPVLAHAPMMRASGEAENASMTTVARLVAAGIPCALQSGYESYVPKTRVVLYEAAIACAHGCDFADALGTITLGAAEILGVADRVGSLAPGKDGDVALYDGDPFEYTSHCIGVLIEGELSSDVAR